MRYAIWYFRSGLAAKLLGWAVDVAPQSEKADLALTVDAYLDRSMKRKPPR